MSLDLWERSAEDVRERWRDIARALRDTGDAEAVPRALQTCFWFGVENSRPGAGPRSKMTLRNLLPSDLLATVLNLPPEEARPSSSGSPPSSPAGGDHGPA